MSSASRTILLILLSILAPLVAEAQGPRVDFEKLREERVGALEEIQRLQWRVWDYDNQLRAVPSRDYHLSAVSVATEELKRLETELLGLESSKAIPAQKLAQLLEFTKSQVEAQRLKVDSTQKSLDSLVEKLKLREEAATQLQAAHSRLARAETAINVALTPAVAAQEFKSQISLYFSLVIALMVLLFFAVVFYDKSVRGMIFGSQSAIQFVTLFSIIIAIILFGITGILEGKELSALLGGLSGYILGRYAERPAPSVASLADRGTEQRPTRTTSEA